MEVIKTLQNFGFIDLIFSQKFGIENASKNYDKLDSLGVILESSRQIFKNSLYLKSRIQRISDRRAYKVSYILHFYQHKRSTVFLT